MRIVVLDDHADAFRSTAGLSRLNGHDIAVFTDPVSAAGDMAGRLSGAEAVVLIQQRTPLTRSMIEVAPGLRLVCQAGSNLGHIDLAACSDHGILVCAKGSGTPNATAELTWGLILAVMRDIPRQAQRLQEGLWLDTAGSLLAGKTLCVFGLGRIGSLVAGYGRAFGMRVLCWGRDTSNEKARQAGYAVAADRASFYASADVLSLHVTLSETTRGIVTAADLARMKPGAVLVNTGRAALIEPGVLEAALRAGRPGRAAVDVYEAEPVLGAAHPLIGMAGALCTPHLGYSVRETYDVLFSRVIEQILAFAAGEPIDVVDPAAQSRRPSVQPGANA